MRFSDWKLSKERKRLMFLADEAGKIFEKAVDQCDCSCHQCDCCEA